MLAPPDAAYDQTETVHALPLSPSPSPIPPPTTQLDLTDLSCQKIGAPDDTSAPPNALSTCPNAAE